MSYNDAKYRRGDWVRWQRVTGLVIAEVSYARDRTSYPLGWEYITDEGTVSESDVLECRRATTEQTPP